MTADRCFRTSRPTAGSKFTHQTSPRCIGHVSHGGLGPRERLCFATFLLGHLPVSGMEILVHDVGADQRFNEPANASPANDSVQPVINALIQTYSRRLFAHQQTARKGPDPEKCSVPYAVW
jgi:hypothetical protein